MAAKSAKSIGGYLPPHMEAGSVFHTINVAETNGSFAMTPDRWQAALATVAEGGRYRRVSFMGGDNSGRTFTEMRIGIYIITGGDATLISQSVNMAAGVIAESRHIAALETPVDLAVGQHVYLACWANDTIDVPFRGNNTDAWKTLAPAQCLYGITPSGLPASFNQGAGKSGNMPCIFALT